MLLSVLPPWLLLETTMPDIDGTYIGRTANNRIRLTAQKGDDQLCFTVDRRYARSPEERRELTLTMQGLVG